MSTPVKPDTRRSLKGRGAANNQSGRFENWQRIEIDDGWGNLDETPQPLRTQLETDTSRTVITYNRSPDVPFDRSINPYRGCEHGCTYCYARPTHAWLGLSPGLDFETRLFYKPDAPQLLQHELSASKYRCQTVCLGANTDAYQPIERRTQLTREILQVLADCNHPLQIITKSALIERDLDLLVPMAQKNLCSVSISLTTLDRQLSRRMEPRAAAPQRRLEAIRRLSAVGIPVQVLLAPIIPALNDHELEDMMSEARAAGAVAARYIFIRLPLEIRDLFHDWLHQHYPLKAKRVINRIRDSRAGKDYDSEWSQRMSGTGLYADLIRKRFEVTCKRLEFSGLPTLDNLQFQPPNGAGQQLKLL